MEHRNEEGRENMLVTSQDTTAPKASLYLPDPAAFDKGKKYSKKKRKTETLDLFCPSPPLKSPAVSRVTGLARNGSYTPFAQSIRTATRVYLNTPEQLMCRVSLFYFIFFFGGYLIP